MNLNFSGVILLFAGVILSYAAVNNVDPRDVIFTALGKRSRYPTLDGKEPRSVGKSWTNPTTPPSSSGFGAAPGNSGVQPNPGSGIQWVSV